MEIVKVGWVLGRLGTAIEMEWGWALTVAPVPIGATEELPAGGEGRSYRVNGYDLLVNYDQDGIAQGVQVTGGLAAHQWTLEQWAVILMAMGMMVTVRPDQATAMKRTWLDFQGYGIHLFAERPGGVVWSVRVCRAKRRSLWWKIVGRRK